MGIMFSMIIHEHGNHGILCILDHHEMGIFEPDEMGIYRANIILNAPLSGQRCCGPHYPQLFLAISDMGHSYR